jgi:hypothetical protein
MAGVVLWTCADILRRERMRRDMTALGRYFTQDMADEYEAAKDAQARGDLSAVGRFELKCEIIDRKAALFQLSATSMENLLAANRIVIHRGFLGWLAAAEIDGHRAYLHNDLEEDGIIVYPSARLARMALREVRPDLVPVEV